MGISIIKMPVCMNTPRFHKQREEMQHFSFRYLIIFYYIDT